MSRKRRLSLEVTSRQARDTSLAEVSRLNLHATKIPESRSAEKTLKGTGKTSSPK